MYQLEKVALIIKLFAIAVPFGFIWIICTLCRFIKKNILDKCPTIIANISKLAIAADTDIFFSNIPCCLKILTIYYLTKI